MHRVESHPIWVGHAGDARNVAAVRGAGVRAFIDLAASDPPAPVARDAVYLRFPIVDGGGNEGWLVRAAVTAVATLVRDGVPTPVFRGAGMSRSPCITAAGMAQVTGTDPDAALALITAGHPADVSPTLWAEVRAAI
jgi:hypothetical protein